MHDVYKSYVLRTREGFDQQRKPTRHELLLQRAPSLNKPGIQETCEYQNHVFFTLFS